MPAERYLTAAQARRVYDRIGRSQDLQVYERRAIDDLLAHADFEHATAVLELGHGTGALAKRLLDRLLPAEASYVGIDVSPRMHELAEERIGAYAGRVDLRVTDGSLPLPFSDNCCDRFLATYVLDLLSEHEVDAALQEAGRLLTPGGLLCLVSLTPGATRTARAVTAIWERLWSLRPELVGGCRPIRLIDHLDPARWATRQHAVVTTFAVSSEILIAARCDPTFFAAEHRRLDPLTEPDD
jgi:ubiquinone/menaquinone biosynthesis C-methylase UbiE